MKKKLKNQFEEVKLVYRHKTPVLDRISVRQPDVAYEIFHSIWSDKRMDLQEEFKMLMLDNCLNMLSYATISRGGTSQVEVDSKLVFMTALLRNAKCIILAHNHPSGNLAPSGADRALTRRIEEIGNLFNIRILDHLILTREGYTSLRETGHFGRNDRYTPLPV